LAHAPGGVDNWGIDEFIRGMYLCCAEAQQTTPSVPVRAPFQRAESACPDTCSQRGLADMAPASAQGLPMRRVPPQNAREQP